MQHELTASEKIARLRDFNNLHIRYYRRCVMFAKSYVCDTMQAEDFVSEAMLVLWEHMASGEPVDNALPFLFSVIRNKVLHFLRHESVKSQVHEHIEGDTLRELQFRISTLEACDPQLLYSQEVQNILKQSLEQMSKQTRQVFFLSRFRGMSNKEIAQELGITVKGVDYHISKALKLLRVDLKDYLPLLDILL
ncbi:RNA polymerase sigma-70 factor [Bacteroides sp. KFT8]|uniref:RNA polymerase sigma-70 factor n=1 Tax=Bacteroides sp. KFT8 TaxID=2025659 RepID=UPI000C05610E|nr:RNA polymerase sigma-70 factor [Bacteroides sp. KFT8]